MANNFYNVDGKRYQFTDEEQTAWEAEQAKAYAAVRPKAWVKLRQERDILLQGSDWRFGGDSPDSAATDDWKTYRQALRELPANTADPTDVTWPTKPS